ncbi:peptidase M23 [Veronia nyctiphanis]|uniref:Peptidase M23 n=1 Tax=Veronia nyctiphanis TaxID=1278244 RepID=A0A4Q0YRD8_9GAMM|nr:peptidoglycan DD-metalloendopeptidase family protein [Veronia nyctiphanis]RXJ73163.1 peptidase M23 [Veronia nyctiphanis]
MQVEIISPSSRWWRINFCLFLSMAVVCTAIVIRPPEWQPLQKSVELALKSTPFIGDDANETETGEALPSAEYVVFSGDKIADLFHRMALEEDDLQQVLESDLNHLGFDAMVPGSVLRFWFEEDTNRLLKLELQLNVAQKVIYQRSETGGFDVQEVEIPGNWVPSVFKGTVGASFHDSAIATGLDESDVAFVINLLKDKINLNTELPADGKFEVVRAAQFVDEIASGQHEIRAVRIERDGVIISAYLHEDGNFYDADGESLQRSFLPVPTTAQYWLSSGFDPRRIHPVTHRRQPHNGSDFAVAVGSPVIATGDGVVVQVANHPYAGKYVVIQHGSKYRTRYLHNSKILVKKGQWVSRGQEIAKSGQSGRVTGPHIHYEFHIRGRPVNPLSKKVPLISGLGSEEQQSFLTTVEQMDAMLKDEPTG